MSLHVCIIGIDGSGKSTVVDALPDALAGFGGLRVASAGGRFRVADPSRTMLAPRYHPAGLPVAARLANGFRKLARLSRRRLRVYPFAKILQLGCQDAAARGLEKRYRPDVVVSEGNLVLSVVGRAANYLRPAHLGGDTRGFAGSTAPLRRAFAALDGRAMGRGWVRLLSRAGRLMERGGFHAVWLPDVVILLDLTPDEALGRIRARGSRIDPHENRRDLAQARAMYIQALGALSELRGKSRLVSVPVGGMSPGQVIRAVDAIVRREVAEPAPRPERDETLGRVDSGSVWWSFFKPGYLARCLVGRFFSGAWREPLFPVCRAGRRFLKEGYSGTVMQDIYDQDTRRPAAHERPFLGYPLHRAVYDRIGLLVPQISKAIAGRTGRVRILSAPCGLAEDVFRSVERARTIAGVDVEVELTALDLDPNERMAAALEARGREAGVDVRFFRGDITDDRTWSADGVGDFDVAVFVGLSGWLPKPDLVAHLRRLRGLVRADGVLVTDTFTAGAYALSGYYAGYRAHYYEPSVYASLLEAAGFRARAEAFESGRDGLNHVIACSPGQIADGRDGFSVVRASCEAFDEPCVVQDPVEDRGGVVARRRRSGGVEALVSRMLGIPYVVAG